MNISGPQECYHFLVGNALVGLCPESQNMVVCIDHLSRMCPCDPAPAKQSKFNQCMALYAAFASKAPNFKGQLFSKVPENRIQFFLNGQMVGSVCR